MANGVRSGQVAMAILVVSDQLRDRCRRPTGDDVLVAGGGQRHTVVEETAPVTAELLVALALSDQEFDRRDLTACAAIYTPPVYVLPRDEVQTVLNGLPFATRTTYTFVSGSD